ncbi:MAG: hypothetical protein ACRDTG_23000 [Pseudonocardiaceae bacterium]
MSEQQRSDRRPVHEDSMRQVRRDIGTLLTAHGMATRRVGELLHRNKNVVSELRKDCDEPPDQDFLKQVLELGVREFDVNQQKADKILHRLKRLTETSTSTTDGPPVNDESATEAPVNTDPDVPDAHDPQKGHHRSMWALGAILVLVGVAVLVVLLGVTSNEQSPEAATITVRNLLALGADGLEPDPSGPAYLSTKTLPRCAAPSNNCKVPDSELREGQQLQAECEVRNGTPMRNYNVADPAPHAANNKHRLSSRLWYRARTDEGLVGYISAIYLDQADHHGHGLPEC